MQRSPFKVAAEAVSGMAGRLFFGQETEGSRALEDGPPLGPTRASTRRLAESSNAALVQLTAVVFDEEAEVSDDDSVEPDVLAGRHAEREALRLEEVAELRAFRRAEKAAERAALLALDQDIIDLRARKDARAARTAATALLGHRAIKTEPEPRRAPKGAALKAAAGTQAKGPSYDSPGESGSDDSSVVDEGRAKPIPKPALKGVAAKKKAAVPSKVKGLASDSSGESTDDRSDFNDDDDNDDDDIDDDEEEEEEKPGRAAKAADRHQMRRPDKNEEEASSILRSLKAEDSQGSPLSLETVASGFRGAGVPILFPDGSIYKVNNVNAGKRTAMRVVTRLRGPFSAPTIEPFSTSRIRCTIGLPRSVKEISLHCAEMMAAVRVKTNGMRRSQQTTWFEVIVTYEKMLIERASDVLKNYTNELSAGSATERSKTQYSDFAVVMLAAHELLQQTILRKDPMLIEREFAARMDAAKRYLAGGNQVVHSTHTWPMLAAYFMFRCTTCFDPLCTEQFCVGCKDRLPPSLAHQAGDGAKENPWSTDFVAWKRAHPGSTKDQTASFLAAPGNKSIYASGKTGASAVKTRSIDTMTFQAELLKSQHLLNLPADVLRAHILFASR